MFVASTTTCIGSPLARRGLRSLQASGAADTKSYSLAPATPPCNFNTRKVVPALLTVSTSTPPTARPYTKSPYRGPCMGPAALPVGVHIVMPDSERLFLIHSVKLPHFTRAALYWLPITQAVHASGTFVFHTSTLPAPRLPDSLCN
jgi:hypothetical protein